MIYLQPQELTTGPPPLNLEPMRITVRGIISLLDRSSSPALTALEFIWKIVIQPCNIRGGLIYILDGPPGSLLSKGSRRKCPHGRNPRNATHASAILQGRELFPHTFAFLKLPFRWKSTHHGCLWMDSSSEHSCVHGRFICHCHAFCNMIFL
jgi:hypothetical protein